MSYKLVESLPIVQRTSASFASRKTQRTPLVRPSPTSSRSCRSLVRFGRLAYHAISNFNSVRMSRYGTRGVFTSLFYADAPTPAAAFEACSATSPSMIILFTAYKTNSVIELAPCVRDLRNLCPRLCLLFESLGLESPGGRFYVRHFSLLKVGSISSNKIDTTLLILPSRREPQSKCELNRGFSKHFRGARTIRCFIFSCSRLFERVSLTLPWLMVALCACFPPKVHDGTRTLRCQICPVTYRNNKLRG
jgi:hypothetical protein